MSHHSVFDKVSPRLTTREQCRDMHAHTLTGPTSLEMALSINAPLACIASLPHHSEPNLAKKTHSALAALPPSFSPNCRAHNHEAVPRGMEDWTQRWNVVAASAAGAEGAARHVGWSPSPDPMQENNGVATSAVVAVGAAGYGGSPPPPPPAVDAPEIGRAHV